MSVMNLFGSNNAKPANTDTDIKAPAVEKEPVKKEVPTAKADPTRISSTMIIRGDIKAEDLIIDGFVKGDIDAKNIIVNNGVAGNIKADALEIAKAKVQGDVKANTVSLSKESVVVGNIKAKSLTTEGSIKGNLDIENDARLAGGAVVVGDVVADDILTEKGAIISGVLSIRNQIKPDFDSIFKLGGIFNEK